MFMNNNIADYCLHLLTSLPRWHIAQFSQHRDTYNIHHSLKYGGGWLANCMPWNLESYSLGTVCLACSLIYWGGGGYVPFLHLYACAS